jgi:hypothetical protein
MHIYIRSSRQLDQTHSPSTEYVVLRRATTMSLSSGSLGSLAVMCGDGNAWAAASNCASRAGEGCNPGSVKLQKTELLSRQPGPNLRPPGMPPVPQVHTHPCLVPRRLGPLPGAWRLARRPGVGVGWLGQGSASRRRQALNCRRQRKMSGPSRRKLLARLFGPSADLSSAFDCRVCTRRPPSASTSRMTMALGYQWFARMLLSEALRCG